jgi:hypothetical protein
MVVECLPEAMDTSSCPQPAMDECSCLCRRTRTFIHKTKNPRGTWVLKVVCSYPPIFFITAGGQEHIVSVPELCLFKMQSNHRSIHELRPANTSIEPIFLENSLPNEDPSKESDERHFLF